MNIENYSLCHIVAKEIQIKIVIYIFKSKSLSNVGQEITGWFELWTFKQCFFVFWANYPISAQKGLFQLIQYSYMYNIIKANVRGGIELVLLFILNKLQFATFSFTKACSNFFLFNWSPEGNIQKEYMNRQIKLMSIFDCAHIWNCIWHFIYIVPTFAPIMHHRQESNKMAITNGHCDIFHV